MYPLVVSRRAWRVALPLAAGIVALLFGIVGLCAQPAIAADSGAPQPSAVQSSPGAALSAEQLANAAANPNAPLTQLELRNVVTPALPGFNGTGNALQFQAILPLKPFAVVPFPTIMKLTVPIVTLPGPVNQTALGPTQFAAQAVFGQSWGSWGIGFTVVAPTDTFTGLIRPKWQVGPAAALIYTGIPNLVFGGVFQSPFPVGSGSRKGQSSTLSFEPSMTYTLPDGWFAGYPDFNWSLNLDSGGFTIPVGLQVGKVFHIGRQPFSASLEAGYNVVRPANGTGVPKSLIGIEFTALFPAL
jgi:hypothetical protein